MTPETKTASPAVVRNGVDDSDATSTHSSYITSELSVINEGQRWGKGGSTGRGGHQVCDGRGRRFNCLAYT